ncbi:MAG: ASKHA domain-containing protein, partial [Methanoregula sp.]|nr:ASKHA domain-containing protein [Methanoregula sp.]
MTSTVTVTFEPDGTTVKDVPRSILELAQGAGIVLRSECGGTGACGKCRVQIVKKYGSISLPSDKERKLLSGAELTQGYRLACQVRVLSGKATIYIPKESRNEVREISGTALEGKVVIAPAVKKVRCVLAVPTLEDPRPDLERLAESLGRAEIPEIPLSVLAVLPETLRSANWDVTAVFYHDSLIAVEAGDTTKELYGIAIDIGSSKIICHLVDLTDGRTIARENAENPQIMYGEDVVSRITFAAKAPENLHRLQSLVVETINSLIVRMCAAAQVAPDRIYEIVFDGNTVMHHLFLGITPKYIGVSPFLPGLKSAVSFPARDLGLAILPEGKVTSLPLIAGYVGSDAVADLMLTKVYEKPECSLVIDIGTNSELMLGNSEKIVVCSAPSGPSFEGAQISSGMKAVGGAIETVKIENGTVTYTTIGNKKPKGICGSGIIDLVAELYSAGIITKTGK